MVAARTTDELLTAVKARAQIPSADSRLSDAEIFEIADEVMSGDITDLLISARNERWLLLYATGITSGKFAYRLPDRALASTVGTVVITDGDSAYWEPPEIVYGEAYRYRKQRGNWASPYAYTWSNDALELLPIPTTTQYTLLFYYAMQPSRLVATSACAVVSSSTATSITTASTVPSAWTSSETLDLIRSTPGGQPWLQSTNLPAIDIAGTSISGTSITCSGGIPTDLTAGSYVSLAGKTCVPAVPEVLWPVLVSATALEVLRVFGDDARVAAEERRLAMATARAKARMAPRSRGQGPKIINRFGPLRLIRGVTL